MAVNGKSRNLCVFIYVLSMQCRTILVSALHIIIYYALNAKFKTLAKRILYDIIIYFIRIRRTCVFPSPSYKQTEFILSQTNFQIRLYQYGNIRRRVITAAMYTQYNNIILCTNRSTDDRRVKTNNILDRKQLRTIRYFN